MMSVRVPSYKVDFYWSVELDRVLKEVGEVPFSIEIKWGHIDFVVTGETWNEIPIAGICDGGHHFFADKREWVDERVDLS
jgi:hypothetical protein